MSATIDVDLIHATVGQKFKSVFDEGNVDEWKKTLHSKIQCISRRAAEDIRTRGRCKVKGWNRVSKESASTSGRVSWNG